MAGQMPEEAVRYLGCWPKSCLLTVDQRLNLALAVGSRRLSDRGGGMIGEGTGTLVAVRGVGEAVVGGVPLSEEEDGEGRLHPTKEDSAKELDGGVGKELKALPMISE